MKILIPSCRSPHALAAIRSFAAKGFEVTAADCTRLSPGLYSRGASRRFLYPSATEKPAEFADAMVAELDRGKYDLLFPTFEEIFLFSRIRDRIPASVKHLVPEYGRMMAVHNKASLAGLCAKHEIPTPGTWSPQSREECERLASEVEYPVVIKLTEGNNSTGLTYADNAAELIAKWTKLTDFFGLQPGGMPLIQKKVPGPLIYSLFLADHGEVVGALIYKPIRMFPDSGGTAFYRESIRHPAAEEFSREFIKALDWHGFIGFDFIDDPQTRVPLLIDVNPRPNPAYNLGLASGVDFTQMFVDMALGRKPAANPAPKPGVRTKFLFSEMIWFAFQFAPGRGYFKRVKDAMTVFQKREFNPDYYLAGDLKPSLVLILYVHYFMFIINTIKPKKGGFMFGCNYDRALADRTLSSGAGSGNAG